MIRAQALKPQRPQAQGLGRDYVSCRRTFGTLLNIKAYPLTFGERGVAIAFNGGVMYEDIFATVFRGDKTKTFCGVKPLYDTSIHYLTFPNLKYNECVLKGHKGENGGGNRER